MRAERVFLRALLSTFLILSFSDSGVHGDDVADAVKLLQSVEPGGKGTAAARKAVESLASSGAMMPVLKGFKGSSPLAVNWLRNAFEEIVEANKKATKPLPADELKGFITDRSESPVARRLAYETLRDQDATVEDQLIPEMLLDPSAEFRRDAVARLIKEASAAEATAATPIYKKALSGAVHEDQVKQIAEALRKGGESVNIQRHFGFLSQWMVIGPFDNKDEKGFAVAYTPETTVAEGKPLDLAAEYDGQLGKVKWQSVVTEDDYGVLDIAKQIQNYKGSLMYASTTWKSDREQNVEIRLGTPNAWKLWVNGKLVFEREEYHRSSAMDQYKVPVSLKAGDNVVLLKVCQNEQTQDWAQKYQFQLRVCDSTGSAVLPVSTTASKDLSAGENR
ncbi:MAG: hypothetical protein U0936_11320 [Planctomycetaceae bacterium]